MVHDNYNEQDEEIFAFINSGITEKVVDDLLALALTFHDYDFDLVQDVMVEHSKHDNENIRGIAILCFGHLARIHGKINKKLVLPIIHNGLQDQSDFVRGHAHSALDDINLSIK